MMRRRQQEDAARAEQQFALERRALGAALDVARSRFAPHRTAWLAGGGLASGFIAGLLPARAASRALRPLRRIAMFALQLPLGALVALMKPAGGRAR